ncbi:hypothetical protein H0H93_012238 [Arthromyces matolae]|nr:hypothetical protein H0H93_012238 [Arthromyces matolae]
MKVPTSPKSTERPNASSCIGEADVYQSAPTRPFYRITVGVAPSDCGSYPSTPPSSRNNSPTLELPSPSAPETTSQSPQLPPPPYTPSAASGVYRKSRKGVWYEVGHAMHPSNLRNFSGEPGVEGFYAVFVGQQTGIFRSWEYTESLVVGVPGCCHKCFPTWDSAFEAYASRYARGSVEGRILLARR